MLFGKCSVFISIYVLISVTSQASMTFVPLKDACIFRPQPSSSTAHHPAKPSETPEKAVALDNEALSILQQMFVKTLIKLGKLTFHCPAHRNGSFPDKLDCRKYYTCLNSTVITKYCDIGMGFEPTIQSCVPNESVPLCRRVQTLPDYKCKDTGVSAYDGSCQKFILCTNDSSAYAASCNSGDAFDQKLLLCLPEEEANCDKS